MKAYILNDQHEPVPINDFGKFEAWARAHDDLRRVGKDSIGRFTVSTVFLGLSHGERDGKPLLWETMVFPQGSWAEVYCERYTSWAEAVAGHQAAALWAHQQQPKGRKEWHDGQ